MRFEPERVDTYDLLFFEVRMQKIAFLLLSILISVSLRAEPGLSVRRELRIPLGPAAAQIGVEKGDGEHWKPLFFSADTDGNLYVPDFYKNRIAVFCKTGTLAHSLPVRRGISPRMNFFTRTPEGLFVTFDEFTLFCLEPSGTLRWSYRFSFGTIPQAVHVTDAGVFVVLPSAEDPGAVAVEFGWPDCGPHAALSRKTNGVSVPIITTVSGAVFAPSISETIDVCTERFVPDSSVPKNVSFAAVLPDGSSVWRSGSMGNMFFLLDTTGRCTARVTVPGASFWTFVSQDGSVWTNSFTDKIAVYTSYGLR